MGISCTPLSIVIQQYKQHIYICKTMKTAIVLALVCLTPCVFGQQGLNLTKAFEKFVPPYECGQCMEAFGELQEQFCSEGAKQFAWIPWIDIKGFCMGGTGVIAQPGAKAICTPFGICVGKNPSDKVVECSACPQAARNAMKAVCGILPSFPFLSIKGSCLFVVDRLVTSDLAGICKVAGFC